MIPYFSIVIPTRNRAKLLRDTMISALHQDFDSFEVIVSDNFNTDGTKEVLNEFINHPRLRYVRTSSLLAMPEHWEFASSHAKGQYVLILTDRSVLMRHALKEIHQSITTQPYKVELCSWLRSYYDDDINCEIGGKPYNKKSQTIRLSSTALLNTFAQGIKDQYDALPCALNSCYHKDLIKRVRDNWNIAFRAISPDFTSAFTFLGVAQEVLFINQPLFILQGRSVSNGNNASQKTAKAYIDTLNHTNYCTHTPIKAPIVVSTMFEDFLSIKKLVNGNLSDIEVSWSHYFELCYAELLQKKNANRLSPSELDHFFDEWNKAFSEFVPQLQQETTKSINALILNNTANLKKQELRRKAKKNLAGKILLRIKRLLEKRRRKQNSTYSHEGSILAITGFIEFEGKIN